MIKLSKMCDASKREHYTKSTNKNHTIWTDEDNTLLKKLYYKERYSVVGIAKILGRSINAVYKQIFNLKHKTNK